MTCLAHPPSLPRTSWSAVAAATAFLTSALPIVPHEPKPEGGSCCYRTPSHRGAWVPLRFETWVSEVSQSPKRRRGSASAGSQVEGRRQTQPSVTFNEERRSLDSRFTLPACSTTGTCGDKQATMPIAGDPNYN